MRSWRQAGLLGLMSQLTALLNDPLPHEVAIASDFGFQILEPRSIPHVKVFDSLIVFVQY